MNDKESFLCYSLIETLMNEVRDEMIIQIKGKVKFPITLDPSVWIFDDRKIIFEDAFSDEPKNEEPKEDPIEKTDRILNQELYTPEKSYKPPVNRSLHKFRKDKVLEYSYVMPIEEFVKNAEIEESASRAILKTNGDDVVISTEQLESAYLHFADHGKPLKEDGPVHLYFGDGSNKDNPIKGVKEIIID